MGVYRVSRARGSKGRGPEDGGGGWAGGTGALPMDFQFITLFGHPNRPLSHLLLYSLRFFKRGPWKVKAGAGGKGPAAPIPLFTPSMVQI